MTNKTRIALTKSMSHWRRMAMGRRRPNEIPTSDCCALCDEFLPEELEEFNPNDCNGCPVKERTGVSHCYKTPYYDAKDAYTNFGINSSQFRAAALKEWKFLASLLPKKKVKK